MPFNPSSPVNTAEARAIGYFPGFSLVGLGFRVRVRVRDRDRVRVTVRATV